MTNSIRCIECLKSCDNFFNTSNMCNRWPKCSSCNVAFPHKNRKSRTFPSNKESYYNVEEHRNAFNNFLLTVVKRENDLSYFPTREYFDISSLNGAVGDQNLCILHFNVRSIQKNVDKLANLLTQLKALPDVLAMTETKLKPDQAHININLESYTFIHSDSKKHSGGVGF